MFLTLRRRRSDAALILESLGVRQWALAEIFEVSTSTVSRVLQGRQAPPAGFEAVLRVVLGETNTRRVLDAIPRGDGSQ